MYEVHILKEGYCRPQEAGRMRASGTVTLLKSPRRNIVVDTGGPADKDIILKGLQQHGLTALDIECVVCTHGHSDHVGNLNLFPDSLHIVGFDICRHDEYILHDFKQGIPYEIDEVVEVWPTPGHTGNDVSVVVKHTKYGTVVVAGDLFECVDDLDNPSIWQENSERPNQQEKGRIHILREADWIVPGHGAMFEVPTRYKRQMCVVMVLEDSHFTSCGATITSSQSSCIIVETD